jgi:RNA recognition motif-containing protein
LDLLKISTGGMESDDDLATNSTATPMDLWSESEMDSLADDSSTTPVPHEEMSSSPPGVFFQYPIANSPSLRVSAQEQNFTPGDTSRHAASVWGSRRKQRKNHSYTTIVIKNLSDKCTNSMVLELLDSAGFATLYDFVYVPTDFRNFSAFGYAFVNRISHQAADAALEKLNGCIAWDGIPLEVDWSMPHQGYAVHVRRYQNSPVMHHSVPEEYKPMIFQGGALAKFPEPTKKVKEPRLRRGSIPGI